MSAEEAHDAAIKLRGLIPKSEELFPTYKSLLLMILNLL